MREVALLSRRRAAGGSAGGKDDRTYRYWAFLSYSHRDAEIADWLHGALEKYRVPATLVGRQTATGMVPPSFAPIFRDRHELAASGDLGHTIRGALAESRCLIVLCSPSAAQSRWTNEEILAFKKMRPDGPVLAAIVGGEPFASEMPGREKEECFPPALRQRYDRRGRPTGKRAEPIAADLRESGDGRQTGLLKLVAGMLGIGLDDLVQREQQRRTKRLTYIAAASLAGMTLTSGLAVFAFDKRDEARDQRREAEGLVGFMLGDLREKLEPIGRLDALDAVGARALQYFEKQDKTELSDEALAQRSRALTLMGEIANTRGDLDGALRRYNEAMAGTAEALRRNPNDAQRIFDHSQNFFWVGQIAFQRGDLAGAEAAMRQYKALAARLIQLDASKPEWQLEGIYADSNLGAILMKRGRYAEAASILRSSLERRESLLASQPGNGDYRKAFSEALAWLSEALEKAGRLDDALAQRERQIAFLKQMNSSEKADAEYRRQGMAAHRAAGRLFAARGELATGIQQLRSSVAIGNDLVSTEPENADWAALVAGSHLELGELQLAAGAVDEAGASARTACDIADRLVARDSSVAEWRVDLKSACLALRTRLALARGAAGEARSQSEALLRLAQAEAAKAKGPDARRNLALAQLLRAVTESGLGDRAAARQALEAALAAWPKDSPRDPRMSARLVLIYEGLGLRDEARAEASRLDGIGYRHPTYLRERRIIQKA